MTDREKLLELINKAKNEYANDVTDHTETDYIVECLLNNGVIVPPVEVGQTVWYIKGGYYRKTGLEAKPNCETEFACYEKECEG